MVGSDDRMERVLASVARLQELVPDTVLVGGSAAAFYARHRVSFDHDHVLRELGHRFDMIMDALEREGDWVTNRIVPGKIILGELGEIETGLRQLIRARPLETVEVELSTGTSLTVPTFDETLRIKAFLIVKRNQTRDYLDVAALADMAGPETAAQTLSRIDDYYADQARGDDAVSSQLIRQLANPKPVDSRTLRELSNYKGLDAKWHDWSSVEDVLAETARQMIDSQGGSAP